MGFAQERAALRVQLHHVHKHVLQVLAWHACQHCGLSRPGVWLICAETGLAERAVRDALKVLRTHQGENGKLDLARPWRYAKGGKGLTTEYVVMPEVAKFSPDQCAKCASVGKTLHPMQGNEG